jgi:uncharacterized protein
MDVYHPFQVLADAVTYRMLGLPPATPLAQAIDFFLYNVPTILITLAVIVFAVGLVKSFVRPDLTQRLLSRVNPVAGSALAAVLGIAAPLCSGSAVPLFVGLVEGGVPLGATLSFLNAAPMVNEVAVILIFSLFGFRVAGLYLIAGLTIAIVNGLVIGRLRLEHLIEPAVFETGECEDSAEVSTWRGRLRYAWGYATGILGGIWLWVVGGLAIGAAMQGYLPTDALVRYAGSGNPFAVPVAVAVAIPLYSNAAGVAPIVSVLVHKGVAMGTVLAFMMAFVALSLPEFFMLRRVMKTRLILVYIGVNLVTISLAGYLLNWLIPLVT